MKKLFILFAALLFTSTVSLGQTTTSNVADCKEVMTLIIPVAGGANAANVAWHPLQKKYYAAQAGNAAFPMVVFDANGKQLSDNSLTTMFDVRGFWYNPKTKTLQANGYDVFGWAEYTLDDKGIPVSVKTLFKGMNQPDVQSGGVYDPKNNVVYFFTGGGVERRSMKDANADTTIVLHLGTKNKADINDFTEEDRRSNYNSNSLIYTGVTGSEIGLLNFMEKKIEFYSLSTGLLTKEVKLPNDAPCQEIMNFSFCNGIYWLNDTKARIWHGYK